MQHYILVDGDDEGDVLADTRTPKSKKRKARTPKLGQNAKDADLFVVDEKGDRYSAANGGFVKINLAKALLRPANVEEIGTRLGGKQPGLVTANHWKCLVPFAGPDHQVYVLVGPNTGNIAKHVRQHHDPQLAAVRRLIEETPKEEAKFVIDQFVNSLKAPTGGLDRFFGRNNDEISVETMVLIWILDANIAFLQLDNPLFKKMMEKLGGREFPSSTTMVEAILPVLYNFAIEEMLKWLARALAFFTSSSHAASLAVVSYHLPKDNGISCYVSGCCVSPHSALC